MRRTTSKASFTPHKLFRELRFEIAKALIAKEFLNAAIMFFALNIPLAILSMSFLYSLVPSLLFFGYRLVRGFRRHTITKLEEGNPEVHEILHTAYEYQNTESLMVQGLMYDLQKKLATVSTGVLIDPRRAIGKVLLIGILVLIPLGVLSVAPSLIQQNPLQNINFAQLSANGERFILDRITPVDLQEDNITYGDINLVELGEDELNLRLQTGGSSTDFSEEQEVQDRQFAQGDTLGDIEASQEGYDEDARVYDDSEVALITAYSCKQRGDC